MANLRQYFVNKPRSPESDLSVAREQLDIPSPFSFLDDLFEPKTRRLTYAPMGEYGVKRLDTLTKLVDQLKRELAQSRSDSFVIHVRGHEHVFAYATAKPPVDLVRAVEESVEFLDPYFTKLPDLAFKEEARTNALVSEIDPAYQGDYLTHLNELYSKLTDVSTFYGPLTRGYLDKLLNGAYLKLTKTVSPSEYSRQEFIDDPRTLTYRNEIVYTTFKDGMEKRRRKINACGDDPNASKIAIVPKEQPPLVGFKYTLRKKDVAELLALMTRMIGTSRSFMLKADVLAEKSRKDFDKVFYGFSDASKSYKSSPNWNFIYSAYTALTTHSDKIIKCYTERFDNPNEHHLELLEALYINIKGALA